MSDSVRELANIIHGLRKDVNGLAGGPQLAHSSIEDGAVDEYDAEGTLVSRVGQQFDGTHTTVSLAGPVPPTPVSATIESGPLSLTARWNGKFVDGEFSPMDLKQVEVWINTVDDYTTSRAVSTIRGELGEQVVVSPLTVEPHYVWLVARSLSGKASEPSVVASGIPNSAADTTALESALDDAELRLDSAEGWIDDATVTLETTLPDRFLTIETDLSEVPTAISNAKAEAVTAAEQYYNAEIVAVNSAITTAQTDANSALGVAQAAQATADGSIRTYYATTPPWADGSVREDSDLGDLWYNSETDQAHRWNGTSWVVIQDNTIATALGKAEDAYELAGKKSTAYYQATQPVGIAGDVWYDTDDNNKPYFCTSDNPQTWTPVRDGEIADAELRAAQDAKTKADTAYDDAVADAALDATNKANEAERLAKEAAALDATAKMETAESNAALEAATIAQTKADTAKSEAIAQAEILVGDKGRVWIQTTAPATGSEFDLWIDTSLNTESVPKNQPNKWTGSIWEPVTDNVALSLASAEAAAKASAAQTAAINAAAADATAKDEALEAVAANEAARIAGIKAGDALTDAKTYVDDEVVEALTTAASTAQTKADEAERLAKEHADTAVDGAVNLINNTTTSNNVERWTFTGGGVGTAVIGDFGGSIPLMSVVTDGNCQVVSDAFPVDASKAYEVRIWLKHPASADGLKPSMYFGMYVDNRTGGSAVSRRVNNANGTTVAPSTNNYFWNDSNPLADVWVEHVGYLLPYGTDPASTVGLGVNVQANVIFEPDNAFAQIRFLNYYNEGVTREVLAAHMTVTEASMESIRLARDSRVAALAAHDRADDAHELAGTAEGNAQTAITSASNKNSVSRSTTAPAGVGKRDGDIWFQFKDTTWTEVIGQWTWNGSTGAWNKNKLSHQTISSVDIGSLTVAGTATIETAVINQLFSDVVVAKTVTATEAFIGTDAIIENGITAKNITASEEVSAKVGQFLHVTTDMLDANSITGTKISGGAIDGMLITGATFQTSGEGAGMKLSSQGFVTYDADGTITTSIPTDGSDAFFSADVAAKSFTSLGDASFRGSGNEFAAGSVTLLAGGVSDPIMSPNVSSIYDITQFPGADGSIRGITSDGTTWYRTVNRSGTSLGDRIERLNASGAVLSSFAINVDPLYGITYLNGELYVYGKDHDRPDSEAYISVYGTDGIFKRQWKVLDFVPVVGFDGITRYPAIGKTDTGLIAVIQARVNSGVDQLEYYNPNGSFNSSVSLDGITPFGDVIFAGVVVLGDRVYAANRNGSIQVWDAVAGFQETDLYWNAPDNEDINGFGLIGNSLYSYSNANRLVKYTNIELDIYDTYEAAYTWVDSTTGAETIASPRTYFQVLGRAKLKVSTTAIPIEASGVRFYMGPANGALHLIGETTTSSTLILNTLPSGWETAAGPPATNSFPSSTAALLASANGVFAVDGQGEGQWGTLQVDSNGAVSLGVVTFNSTARFDGASSFYSNVNLNGGASLRINDTGDASESSTAHGLQIGPTSGSNLRLDNNEILQVDNGVIKEVFFRAGIKTGAASVLNGGITTDAIYSVYTYGNTSTASPNMFIGSGGRLHRSTSARRYKLAVEPLEVDEAKILSLKPSTWFDKNESESLADYTDAKSKGKPTKDENGKSLFNEPSVLRRTPGMVAEEVEAAGLEEFVIYGEDGEVEGLMYDRLGVALIPVVAKQRSELDTLKDEVAGLKALIRSSRLENRSER